VSEFLERSHLCDFVASSYASQNRFSHDMDKLIIQYENYQKTCLAEKMPAKEITIAEDETFHQGLCLVGIDCGSNFIITEKYKDDRTCDTWSDIVSKDLAGYNVSVIQVVSDEAKALIKHAEKSLGVPHSPDLFHMVEEISKGVSLALSSKNKVLELEYRKAKEYKEQVKKKKKISESSDKKLSAPSVDFVKEISNAIALEKEAFKKMETATSTTKKVHDAKRRIGKVYHPVNLRTGKMQDSKMVETLLNKCFSTIYTGTSDLSKKCIERIDKAKRVLPKMIATIHFFFMMTEKIIARENYKPSEKKVLMNTLIPSMYLQKVSNRTRDLKLKKKYKKKSQRLLKTFKRKNYSKKKRDSLLRIAEECARVFQRSSSCVEGRNAQLALRHTSVHRITDVQLQVQTILHNYTVKRKDGTTAANRFFEQEHDDLFEWLLNKMDYSSRPRKRLSKAG
jgi:hypothetical protein